MSYNIKLCRQHVAGGEKLYIFVVANIFKVHTYPILLQMHTQSHQAVQCTAIKHTCMTHRHNHPAPRGQGVCMS
jgi:hypothetical protein